MCILTCIHRHAYFLYSFRHPKSIIMLAAPWFCDGCGRSNSSIRYQCQQCRGYNTYDLCDQCIGNASMIHPNHTFLQVSQPVVGIPVISTMWPYSSALPTMTYTPPTWSTYIPYRQPTVSITYEYKTLTR
ncbi:unnamed protein product [Rotaria magnacalcarata]